MESILKLKQFKDYLQARPRDMHKGLAGHVVIVGGNIGFSGAVLLAAQSALRVGAGLVSIATHPQHAAFLNLNCPEIMVHGIDAVSALTPLVNKANVCVLGPGLGQDAWAKRLWEYMLQQDLPLVLDADGLNLLALTPCTKKNWILTPHPGEAGRLLQTTTQTINQDRVAAVTVLNARYGGVSILKGAGTLIKVSNEEVIKCDKGNPGMATAGMGDVLAGVIGGLLAPGLPISVAAKLGVLVHALAGDLAAIKGERGMIASDVIACLRQVVNSR